MWNKKDTKEVIYKTETGLLTKKTILHFHALEKEMATHSSVLAGESQGRGSLVGCCLWGDLAAAAASSLSHSIVFLYFFVLIIR